MPQHHQPSELAALGRTWVEAWNARDLERVLALYDEDTTMTSDRIPALGFDASGTVHGKERFGRIGARRSGFCRTCISR
jgi:ketosteroid isomerase-like protein